MSDRDFKGIWIPNFVWLDKNLNALDKIILAEIDSLDAGGRGCYASNAHIAEFCQCSESKVSHSISKLTAAGYLQKAISDGRQRVIKSNLTPQIAYRTPPKEPQKAAEKKNYTKEYKVITEYLNTAAGTNYRATSKATQSHISARLNEGFTVDDFKTVIDNKCAEWKGTDFERYLRPETLFGTKFESYLNTPKKANKQKADLNDYRQGVDYF